MYVEFCTCLCNVHFPHPETGKRLKTSALESITCSSYTTHPSVKKEKKEVQHCDAGYSGYLIDSSLPYQSTNLRIFL